MEPIVTSTLPSLSGSAMPDGVLVFPIPTPAAWLLLAAALAGACAVIGAVSWRTYAPCLRRMRERVQQGLTRVPMEQ